MEKFRFSFIFLDANKDLEINADESVIQVVVTEFSAAFAENIDFDKHVINLSVYRRNDAQLLKNIDSLVNKYKGKVPQIQQLPQFLRNKQRMNISLLAIIQN